MKRNTLLILSILLLALCLIQPAFAADDISSLVDEADLLTDSEEAALSRKLDEISLRQNMDIVIVTVFSTEERTAAEYADDTYDYSGYGDDGILLLISLY